MIEDIYEPLARYRDEFREKFSRISADTFERLVKESGVDISANAATVAEIKTKEAELEKISNAGCWWKLLLAVLWAGCAVGAVYCFLMFHDGNSPDCTQRGMISGASALALALVAIFLVHPRLDSIRKAEEALKEAISKLKQLAWEQLAPLNRLFTWDILTGMMKECVPRLEFDPFFNEARLEDLRKSFDWNNRFNDDISILFSHSGVINDNPFVICRYLKSHWGSRTYSGTKTISYTTTERGSDGKLRTVRRYQTLVATIERPVPEYSTSTLVIYGNEAAPELNFSRTPSNYSGEDGFFSNIGKKMELKKLEKFARDLEDDSDFTMMSNREFEVLFHAKDRDDEVGFRVLFTALAQQQMVKLLNDKEQGFGDDFSFVKSGKINLVAPEHLDKFDLDTDPKQFAGYDLEAVKAFFISRSQKYFREIYFSLAPLLTVPLYQQMRTRKSIYEENKVNNPSFWETESFVNYLGHDRFKHSDCITQSILKTSRNWSSDGVVSVTASGYRGKDRVEFVPVWGNDGRLHNVPVEWVEYLPVSRTSEIGITVADRKTAAANPDVIRRRLRLNY